MKALALCLCALGLTSATPALADAMMGLEGPAYIPPDTTGALPGDLRTPTMKRERLEQALALRDEAHLLLAKDGGTLTPAHQAYVQHKACDVLGRSGPRTGSLAPDRSRACS